jgi:hypothetical protein
MVTRGMRISFVLFRPPDCHVRGYVATGTAIILIVAEGGKGIFVLQDTEVGRRGQRDGGVKGLTFAVAEWLRLPEGLRGEKDLAGGKAWKPQ